MLRRTIQNLLRLPFKMTSSQSSTPESKSPVLVASTISATDVSTKLESLTVSDQATDDVKPTPRSPPKPKIKKRKGQSEEDYEAQKLQYESTGPIIETSTVCFSTTSHISSIRS